MADHYRAAVDRLEQVADRQRRLTKEYAKPGGHSPKVVADLHQVINLNLKLAEVHSHLAIAQALHDLEARP